MKNSDVNGSGPSTGRGRPFIRKTAASGQLIVDGEPFLMLAGELHNSSFSCPEYMSQVWPEMRSMNVNTLLGSVSWEMIEPEEGRFNFTELDECIRGARKYGLHLVLLWFGSFKNALSTYVPAWVKLDPDRFPRARVSSDHGLKSIELISPFCQNAWEADARAFAALMKHLREFDEDHSTVVMVQVENEPGVLGDTRDRSKIAEQHFNRPIPKRLFEYLRERRCTLHPKLQKALQVSCPSKSPNWAEAFDDPVIAEELFMADAFSRFVEVVAAAGKAEYDIPFYANVWLPYEELVAVVGGGSTPGIYPSGGPVPHALDVYRCNAPSLDFIAPDLYLNDYENICRAYRSSGQPLFIPEQKRDENGARRVWLAYGTYLAMGCSPFGIDSLALRESSFTRTYALLGSMSKQILDAQAHRPDDMMGFFFDELEPDQEAQRSKWSKDFGDFRILVERAFVFGKPGPGAGMIIRQSSGSFLLIGWGFQVTFESTNPRSTFTGLLRVEEKTVHSDGSLHTGKILNGDETRSGSFVIMPNEAPDYGGFPIAVTIGSRTMIAECTPYSIEESCNEHA